MHEFETDAPVVPAVVVEDDQPAITTPPPRRERAEPYLGGGQLRSIDMELLLTVLLALMIPGLLTYLVPERDAETARD